MKDDRRYLDEMWKIAERLQMEEQQKQEARKKNRLFLLFYAMVYSALAVLFFFLISIPHAKTADFLAACGAVLVIGFGVDAMISHNFQLEGNRQ